MHADSAQPRGRIRIDLPAAFGRLQALPVVLACVQQYPQLQPHLSFSDRFIDPVEEDVDVVVRVGGPDVWPDGAGGTAYLGSERHVFCASPAYLKHSRRRP
jgi:DNA-binding transcriptional LysR family regulator